MKAAMQGSTVSCISLNTGRSESWVQLLGHQLLSAPSANLWAQAVGSWLDCRIPAPAPQSLLVSGSLHKHNKMTSFLAVPTSSSSQTTAMLKPTTKAAKRCCLRGDKKHRDVVVEVCWLSRLFFPLFCYFCSIQNSQFPWKVMTCTIRCVACVCSAPLQPPCLGG